MTRPTGPVRGAAERGFTLVELAVVIAIVGFLLGAILVPLSTQYQVQKVRETQRNLEELKTVLLGFAMTNGRLPCPDGTADANGVDGLSDHTPESATSTSTTVPCATYEGFLPYQTLGVPPVDAWGDLYLYAVTPEYTYASVPGGGTAATQLDLQDGGTLTVNTTVVLADGSKSVFALTTTAPAVILSAGANTWGGRNIDGTTVVAPTGADEIDNTIGGGTANQYVSRPQTPAGGPGCDDSNGSAAAFCEFDDVVTWLPAPLVLGRLVAAGQLP